MEVGPVVGQPGSTGRGRGTGQGGGDDRFAAAATADALARAAEDEVRAVVLVEGVSDQAAVEALAVRRGRDLEAEGVVVVPMGGATSVGRFLDRFAGAGTGAGAGLTIAGLCDAAEEPAVRRVLERHGLPPGTFEVCHADLEDELIRALGVAAVERLIEADGGGRQLRTFRRQANQPDRSPEAQLRRFVGTRAGGKARAAQMMVGALDLDRVPAPLDRILDAVRPD
jgi:hypothetical protein